MSSAARSPWYHIIWLAARVETAVALASRTVNTADVNDKSLRHRLSSREVRHWEVAVRLTFSPDSPQKVGSNLGPNADNLGPKQCTETQNKARRTNQIAFLPLPWAQEVSGSNPDAPTTNLLN